MMNEKITFYHNPRCAKSREALALLTGRGVNPEIVLYLESPPGVAQLKKILAALDIPAAKLLRTKEEVYKDVNPDKKPLSESAALQAMVRYPKLIERPIAVRGHRAVIGRPPEKVLELIS